MENVGGQQTHLRLSSVHLTELQSGICPKSQKERETSTKIPNWALSDIDGYQRVLLPQHQMLLIVVTCHVITLVDIYCVFTGYCQALVPHSSTLAGKIPWTEEPGRLQSMGLQRVRHD